MAVIRLPNQRIRTTASRKPLQKIGYNRFMRILPPVEEEIRGIVRDERAKDPLITVSGLKAALEKHFERGFSHQYVSKISDKVAREGLVEADRTRIEARMIFTRENYRMMRERMLKCQGFRRKPCVAPPASWYDPAIAPAGLMPLGNVLVEP